MTICSEVIAEKKLKMIDAHHLKTKRTKQHRRPQNLLMKKLRLFERAQIMLMNQKIDKHYKMLLHRFDYDKSELILK